MTNLAELEARFERIERAFERLGLQECSCGEWQQGFDLLVAPETPFSLPKAYCPRCLEEDAPEELEIFAEAEPEHPFHFKAIQFLRKHTPRIDPFLPGRLAGLSEIYYEGHLEEGHPISWRIKDRFIPVCNRFYR